MIRTTWGHKGVSTLVLIALLATSAIALTPSAAHAAGCTPAPRADLSGCNFANANLSNSNLSRANLTGTNFTGANLEHANLSQTNISAANFTNADLIGADLVNANVTQFCSSPGGCPNIPITVSLSGPEALLTVFTGPNFTSAILTDTHLAEVHLAAPPTVNLGTICVVIFFHTVCFQVFEAFTDAALTGVTSGGIDGKPASLPGGWGLIHGTLTMSAGPLQLTTSSLPNGTVKTAYSASLAAFGGLPPYKWSVTGNLPPGLHLGRATGTISGKPQIAGTYSFTALVTDSKSMTNPPTQNTAAKVLSITIQ